MLKLHACLTISLYLQTIISQVGHELNRLQQVFMRRNPEFTGGISLGGHSLGSLILFDLLYHQRPTHNKPKQKSPEPETVMFPQEEEEETDEFGEAMPPVCIL